MSVHGSEGDPIERTFDYVIASRSLQGKFKNMEIGARFRIKATQGGYLSGEKTRRFRNQEVGE